MSRSSKKINAAWDRQRKDSRFNRACTELSSALNQLDGYSEQAIREAFELCLDIHFACAQIQAEEANAGE